MTIGKGEFTFFVKNLSYACEPIHLCKFFLDKIGNANISVIKVRIMFKEDGLHCGYGFIKLKLLNDFAPEDVILATNELLLLERPISVVLAEDQER